MTEREVTDWISQMIAGPVFLSAFFSWFIAQALKVLIDALRRRTHSSRDVIGTLLWKTGGMPSSHASIAAALAVSVGFRYGPTNPTFVVTVFYGILVIRDAVGVRRAAGSQARAINSLGEELKTRFGVAYLPVKEINGHTPIEVIVGVLLGSFIALAFSTL